MSAHIRSSRPLTRVLAVALATVGMIGSAQAQSRHGGFGGGHFDHGGPGYHGGGYHGGGYHGGGRWLWGGVGLGVGLGLASYYGSWYPAYSAYPGYVVSDGPVVYDSPQPVAYPRAVPSSQPVIYPRNGQSAQQTEADSNACSDWAGRQPNATADPSVFQRAVGACMDGRGYTVR